MRLNSSQLSSCQRESKSRRPSSSSRKRPSSSRPSNCYTMRVRDEEGSERGTTFTSSRPSTKFRRSERYSRLPRKTGWPSSRDKSWGTRFLHSSQGSGRRKRLCSFTGLSSKRMKKWRLWSRIWHPCSPHSTSSSFTTTCKALGNLKRHQLAK